MNHTAYSQNLVPNGSFEQYKGCPASYAQFDSVMFWFNPQQYPGPGGSPDYFNSCTSSSYVDVPQNYWGYQQPHSGVAYAGLIPWYINPPGFREYIEVQLTSPLLAGSCYYFEMFASICNVCRYTTDDLAVYFSDTLVAGISNNQPLPFIPQVINSTGFITDTLSWTIISGTYLAFGGESYIIIGNFNNDASTDTLFFNSGGFHEPYFYIDDVSLTQFTPCNIGVNENNEKAGIILYPNPVSNNLCIKTGNNQPSEITLFDVFSVMVLHEQFTNNCVITTGAIRKGIYFYEVRTLNCIVKKGKILKE